MDSCYTGQKGELNFERDFVEELKKSGWEPEIINHPQEIDLIRNWQQILFDNNKGKLHDVKISDDEMNQVMEYVRLNCNSPVKANIFINGKNICIKRDSDSEDKENAGKEVYLDIFDPTEIAGGRTRYQIVEQPIFKTSGKYTDKRGDVMLLINGIPVIHIELKASGVSIDQATNQIQKYAREGVFTGLFGLIQVFFAITPEDALYFANPGDSSKYNNAFFFRWGDRENNQIRNWRKLCRGESSILSIPEAHQLIGYYVVASKDVDTLMVVRSYQYNAIKSILHRVNEQKKYNGWKTHNPLGGYIWCTTGGGKTLSSFKAGQMIIDKCLADKVVFVVDRVELNNQSLEEYNSFQREGEEVQETYSTNELFVKLKSNKSKDALIVTSIQKLNRINDDAAKQKLSDLKQIKNKRIVFIIDEAHRSQFGKMHETVKKTFSTALFIGFTGTPIFSENDKDGLTTETTFGQCLSVYSIADGIRDNNVLGFDPKAIKTYKDDDLKEAIALKMCNATTAAEAKADKEKYRIYKKYKTLDMTTTYDKEGNVQKGIEDLLPSKQYNCDKHRNAVVDDILSNWDVLSLGEKGTHFHAILATTSIPEAYEYYKLFKKKQVNLKVTALFDPNVDNSGDSATLKEEALVEIINDYNAMFSQHFDRDSDPQYKKFKKDIVARLAHKKQYKQMNINGDKDTLDLVIVVDQLLTGFDSKFVNTLYLDKVLEEDNMIQAISRTNRVYDNEEKPFGIFRFYRKPYTMQINLDNALRLYCEGDTTGVVVNTLDENLEEIDQVYKTIKNIFEDSNIEDFCRLPDTMEARQKFKKEFSHLKVLLNSIKLQGFKENEVLQKEDENGKTITEMKQLPYTPEVFRVLEMRYRDMNPIKQKPTQHNMSGQGFNINASKSEMAMDKIDEDYLESHFKKVVPVLMDVNKTEEEKDSIIQDFEKELPRLSMKDQKYAKKVIADIRAGVLIVDPDITLMQYIKQYIENDFNEMIESEANKFGLNPESLREICVSTTSEKDLNDCNRFTRLKDSADKSLITKYFGLSLWDAETELDKELKDFVLNRQHME